MRDYRHMMAQVTLSDGKKEEIMEILENQGTQKRRMPKMGKFILAAALAVGCVLSIAAGLPMKVYNFIGGGSLSVMTAPWGDKIGGGEITLDVPNPEDAPLVLEDGRLWFVGGGERVDVTDLIDENTPYIYEHTDPDTGIRGYLILGGTVDNFGWAEYADMGGGSSGMTGNNFGQIYVTLDGERLSSAELTKAQRARIDDLNSVPTELVHAPWLEAAAEQLGIENY